MDFSPETLRLWVSFNYYDFKPGSRVHYVVNAQGETLLTGDLTCCEGPTVGTPSRSSTSATGRSAVPPTRSIIVVGKTEASRGTFVVRGTGGFDNDNCDDETNTQRGNLSSRFDC